jgi:flagellar operon protein
MSIQVSQNFSSIQQLSEQYLEQKPGRKDLHVQDRRTFEEILLDKQNLRKCLHFSKHADTRLAERNISLTEGQKQRLEDGTEKARDKGIRESLVMVDQLAFIVNVENNTVVTAISMDAGQAEKQETIFTNIDGAVII